MTYDILIKNGTVVDGSGGARYRADVGVVGDKIAAIGRINEKARTTIDAEGHVVSPGFVDGHTHMDAQVFWDPIGSSSCYHGVTSAVMGNCGFTLAPCKQEDANYVFRNLERAEDISREAMLAGIDWTWETFPEYLDALEALPKGINYAGYIGHSALRTHVMGERAFTESATEDEVARMCAEVGQALNAGAIGFSTSRTRAHMTADDRPVASRQAEWDEVRAIVNTMGEMGKGIFELAYDMVGPAEQTQIYRDQLKALAVESGVTQTWGMFSTRRAPGGWRPFLDMVDETAAMGGRIQLQVHSRALNVLLSFLTATPFDKWDVWRDIRALPLAEQKQKLADPAVRAKLVEVANGEYKGPRLSGTEPRPPDWDWVFPMADVNGGQPSMAELARQRGVDPVELMIDLALEHDFRIFFLQPIANENQDDVLELMKYPRSVVTFSDSGAHVSQIIDSSLQSHMLRYWVREKEAFTLEEAVRKMTYDTATLWGLHDRGLVRKGMAADLLVFDPQTVGPAMPTVEHDLPAGARRLKQVSTGIKNTIVNGEVLLTDNQHSGAAPGRLLRVGSD